jgi:hypothetical protein
MNACHMLMGEGAGGRKGVRAPATGASAKANARAKYLQALIKIALLGELLLEPFTSRTPLLQLGLQVALRNRIRHRRRRRLRVC